MALDRFVYWQNKKPSDDELKWALEDYLSSVGEIDYKKPDWWIITLPGVSCSPFRRIAEISFYESERWFEIFIQDDNIDVLTRQADEFTNNVAQGFAELCARYWEGRLEC